MNLRRKTLFILSLTLLLLIVVIYTTTTAILDSSYNYVEQQTAIRDMARIRQALEQNRENLAIITSDYAFWDDTVAFLATRDPRYPESNLSADTFASLQLSLVMITDATGELRFGGVYNMKLHTLEPIDPETLDLLQRAELQMTGRSAKAGASGLIRTPTRLLLLTALPILPSSREGSGQGTLIMAYELDERTMRRLSEVTLFQLSIYSLDNMPMPVDVRVAQAELSPARPITTLVITERSLAAYTLLLDLDEQPAAIMRADIPRFLANQRQITSQSLLIALMIAAVLISALIALLLERTILRRLKKLSMSFQHIAANTQFSERVPAVGRDEIAQLGQDINRALTALEQSHHDLEIARAAAEQANQAKSAFLANMSHELRTPLNAIIGYSELLLEAADDDAREDDAADLRRIRSSGQHLLSVINDILDLSKIEAGRMEITPESIDLPALIADLALTAEPLMRRNHNHLTLDCPSSLGSIYTDKTRLRQILLNLLSNAAKFTESGMVELRVRPAQPPSYAARYPAGAQPWLRFEVEDSGIGMSANQIERLFQPFVQVDSSSTRKYGGTGLGLAISRRLSQMLGGDIQVQSAPGSGSLFIVTLPAVLEAEQAEPAPGDG